MPFPENSLYIELLKRSLIDYRNIGRYESHPLQQVEPNWKTFLLFPIDKLLRTRNFAISKLKYVDKDKRLNGYDWPANADTMIGMGRLNNIEQCVHTILQENIAGDLIETGVWRGGAAVLMRAILKEQKVNDRKVWLADSFQGIPAPDPAKYPADRKSKLHEKRIMKVSLEEVKQNFEKYDLLDEQTCFLPGWFKNTLANAPIQTIALLRLDGDLYESTIQSMTALYPRLSPGGFVIIDDYNAFDFCKAAVDDYRKEHHIIEPIVKIDREAVYWRKQHEA